MCSDVLCVTEFERSDTDTVRLGPMSMGEAVPGRRGPGFAALPGSEVEG